MDSVASCKCLTIQLKVLICIHISSLFQFCIFFLFFWLPSIVSDIVFFFFFCIIFLVLVILVVTLFVSIKNYINKKKFKKSYFT